MSHLRAKRDETCIIMHCQKRYNVPMNCANLKQFSKIKVLIAQDIFPKHQTRFNIMPTGSGGTTSKEVKCFVTYVIENDEILVHCNKE